MAAMVARSADTDPEAEKVQVDLLRRAGPGRRTQMALSLSGEVIGLARRAIQRSLPEASQEEVQLHFVALQYGQGLSSELGLYLAARAR
jgi:hypothetical protein